MQARSNNITEKILPFIGMGIFLVIVVIALVLFSYVLFIGGAIGLVLFAIAYIKNKFFPNRGASSKHRQEDSKKIGKTYDHNEFK